MKRVYKRKSVSVEPQVETNLTDLIYKMQQQLTFLEKKIDTLISQSSERPSGAGNYVKPFQQFDKPRRFDRPNRESSFRERTFTKAICSDCKKECEVPFRPTGDRPVYCKECFPRHKEGAGVFKAKFERNPREVGFAKYRSFNKPLGRDKRRPGIRKKPGFRGRKGRD
jgi:CxxC-x17-CxxC domain-containing protein